MGTVLTCILTCDLIFILFLFLAGMIIVRQKLQFGRQACSTTGVIVDFHVRPERRWGRGGSRMVDIFHPVIQFQRVDGLFAGQQITCELSIGSYPPLDCVGKQVPLLYLPSTPQGAQINTFFPMVFEGCTKSLSEYPDEGGGNYSGSCTVPLR